MKTQPILPMLLLLFVHLTHAIHNCIHDQIVSNQTMVPIDDSRFHHQRRLLQQTIGYGPIRIYYEYNTTTINENEVVGKNLIKIMNIIKQFWARTIQIDYLPALSFEIPLGFDPDKFSCLSFKVPRTLIDRPTPDKDFGFLIEALDDGDSGVTAYSYPCAYSTVNKRPLWGFIHWNKHYLSFNPLNFQENLHIGIHQILHVLGFSQILYTTFKNSQIFVTKSGGSYLDGPFLRKELIRQYGCADPPGMALETNGGSGTAYSHWSRKTANNQLMTAGVAVNNPTISYLTLALLQQTGWYRRIFKQGARFINFGYQKGCQMLEPSNCQSNQYCKVKDEKRPDYDKTAVGYCKNDSLSNCMYTKFYVNFICTDPNYAEKSLHADQGIIDNTGEIGGYKSRSYVSDLRKTGSPPSKYSFRCYETLCSPDYHTLTIRVGQTYGLCMFPNQQIRVKGYDGTLKCPQSFKQMCAIQRCKQECNANGICLGGRCLCDPNYEGQTCQKLSSTGTASSATLFLPSENNNCVIGTFRNIFGECEECQISGCAKCNSEQCFLCLDESLPANGRCRD